MKIAIDFDNVLVDSSKLLIEIYNKKYKKNITFNDINKWNFWGKNAFEYIYPRSCKRVREVILLDENIPHYLFLLNNKHDVDILTQSRCGINAMIKRLEQLNIKKGIEYIDLIKTRTKKVEYQYSVFFDDNPQMVYDIQKYPSKYLLLFDCPWNASIDSNEYRNVFRIHEWHNILEKIEMIEKICK